jgi:flagellar basal body-associated protein FliL
VIDHADMADLDEPGSVKAAFTLIMIVSLNVLFAVAAVLGSLMFTVEPQLAATVALGVPVVDHWLAPRGVPTVMKTTGVVFRGVSRLAAVVEQSLNREPSASDALAAAAASVSEQPDTLITTFTHRVRASVQPWI